MSKLVGVSAAEQELRKILDETKAALQELSETDTKGHKRVVDLAAERLLEYTERTEPADLRDPNEAATIEKFDNQADEARRSLRVAVITRAIDEIEERTAELNRLSKVIRQEVASAKAQAKRLRLTPVKEAVDAIADTIEGLKAARAALDTSDADELAVSSKIDRLVRSFGDVRGAIPGLGIVGMLA